MAENRLVCPDHKGKDEKHYLEELDRDDSIVVCPDCGYNCQNFIKYPEVEVMNLATGETYMKNVLTGERV